jgi:FKBP-type peptidyl-prolyl cis-trans isomerase FklB
MNLRFFLLILAALTVLARRSPGQDPSLTAIKDRDDRISYSIGVNIGAGLKEQTQQQGLNLKPDIVVAGVRDALQGARTLLSEQEVRETLNTLQRDLAAKMGAKNKQEGEVFLAENKKKPGIRTLPDGLQYQVLTEGRGAKPKTNDTIRVNYKGTFIDGTEFDSSAKRNGPVSLPLSRVIPGWIEAIQMMPVGSKWRLFIPSNLAYGEQGAPPVMIGPNTTLIFEVELVGIEPRSRS